MAEEKKDEKIEEKAAPAQTEPVKAEAPQAAPAQPAQAQVAPAQVAQKLEPEAVKKEKPANCAACNKSIRKKRHYYREGKYFCTKRCWKTTLKKDEKPEEAAKS